MEQAQGTEEEKKSLSDNISLLAKSIELLGVNESGKPVIEELVSSGANLRYLNKAIKLDARSESLRGTLEAITSAFCGSLVQALDPTSAPLNSNQSADSLTTVTSLLLAALSLTKKNVPESKSQMKPVVFEQSIF